MTRLARLALATAGGALLWTAFPPLAWGWLAIPGVALVTLAVIGIRAGAAAVLGLASGLAFFLPLLPWLTVVGTDAWLALSTWCAAWFALMGAATAVVVRLPGWPAWVACLWVGQEALRGSIPWGGFPWGRLAFAQADTPLGHVAPWLGLAGTTFAVALAGALLAAAVRARSGRARAWHAGGAAAIVGAAWLLPVATVPVTGTAVIAAVQGGTPQTGMGAMDVRRAVLDGHVRETLVLAGEIAAGRAAQPAFVLWPENASDIDPYRDPAAAKAITASARAVGAPIVVGAVVDAEDPAYAWNAGIVWDPQAGPVAQYVKTHPVPFGEYIPFRAELSRLIDRFDRIPRDFAAGSEPGHLSAGGIAFGDVICFEVAYDDVIGALMADPQATQLITVQTNNATYAGTAQPEQQLAITRMRALETGRAVLVAATSGISARIGADGSVATSLGEGTTGSIDEPVPLVTGAPWSAVTGRFAGILAAVVGAGAVVIGARASRRRLGTVSA